LTELYIIAEIGINFNNSIENCYKLIDSAVAAGCHAAKFQLFNAKNLYPKSVGSVEWKNNKEEYSYDIYEAVKTFELPYEWLDSLISYCNKKNIEFLASVFDLDGLDILVEKGVKKIKLSSYTVTHYPLIESVSKTGLPIILSTGGSTLAELEGAIHIIQKYHNNLTVLHCSIQYPTALGDVNLGILKTISKAFPNIKIGYSDHTKEVSSAPVQAVYLGAVVIEKHITLDKNMEGPDHFFALNPDELKDMVVDINQAKIDCRNNNFKLDQTIYGSTEKICHKNEQYLRDFAYMTLFSKKNIKKGSTIEIEDISILRPGEKGKGLDPKYLKLFSDYNIIASKDIPFESPIQWESIL
jgi:N,N'-diacetyllegionaminate synthase